MNKKDDKDTEFTKNFGAMMSANCDGICLFDLWTNCVKVKLPKDFTITRNEIKSELVKQCIYLADIYDKTRNDDYLVFCNMYAVKRAVNEIYGEYNKMKANKDFKNDYSETYTDYYVCKNGIYTERGKNGGYYADEHDSYEQIERRIDGGDKTLVTRLYETAIKMDKDTDGYYRYAQIIDDLRMGMTQQQIADELGVTQAAVSCRVAALKNVIKQI